MRKAPSGEIWVGTGLDIRFEQSTTGPTVLKAGAPTAFPTRSSSPRSRPTAKIPWTKPEDITVGPESRSSSASRAASLALFLR